MSIDNYCPSQDWDRYYASQELPEECPVCKKPNYDEDTEEWVCPAHEGFCSEACADKYDTMCREEAAQEEVERQEELRQHHQEGFDMFHPDDPAGWGQ